MLAHPGYPFVHHMLHYDPSIPLIISPPCDGTIADFMSYIDNPLKMRNGGPSPLWLQIARQLILAVSYVHSLGMAHCDIKPSNILYTIHQRSYPSVHCYLSDFDGMQTDIVFSDDRPTTHTEFYAAPEVRARVPRHNMQDADLYCVATTMLELLVLPNDDNLAQVPVVTRDPADMWRVWSGRVRAVAPDGALAYCSAVLDAGMHIPQRRRAYAALVEACGLS
jgi:serine/threonine protein kinase